MYENVVIIGAGQAAVQTVDTLRRNHYAGRLTLIGAEPTLPYQRPPLSKKYLAGTLARERLLLRPPAFYTQRTVDTRLGRRVEEIARGAQRLRLDDGTSVPYDALLLATGSHPRALAVPGTDLQGVFTLRTIADVEAIRPMLTPGVRLVIVGGGYIGLEVASTARGMGVAVTVLEATPRLIERVTSSAVSKFYAAEHERHGVRVVCDARVRAIAARPGQRRPRAVLTEDGAEFAADVVLLGVGVVPATALAASAGLQCADGIEIDAYCRTADPVIYAAGDCANQPNPRYGRRLRLESVDNAFEQGTSAALNLLGRAVVHDKVPWFWSDQYDLKLVIVGLSAGHDEVIVRGDPAARAFTVCYLLAGELIAVDSINTPKDQLAARKLIPARARPDRDRLANPAVPLQEAC